MSEELGEQVLQECDNCGREMADAVTYPTSRDWKCWWCEERVQDV